MARGKFGGNGLVQCTTYRKQASYWSKMAEPIKLPFGSVSVVDPWN